MRQYLQNHKNILLVDDDADDRELFAEAIEFIDPTVTVTLKKDGDELGRYLEGDIKQIDVIFLDLNMPRKNGKECLVEVRNHPAYKHVPIVIFSTSVNPVDIEETYQRGASYFLRKPNSFEDLKEILSSMLECQLQLGGERSKENFLIKTPIKLTE